MPPSGHLTRGSARRCVGTVLYAVAIGPLTQPFPAAFAVPATSYGTRGVLGRRQLSWGASCAPPTRGLHVHVWTINEPDRTHRLLDLGVDGIMTDHIDMLRGVLKDRGTWV